MRRIAFLIIIAVLGSITLAVPARSAGLSHSISLDLHNFPSNGHDGYTNATASNGQTYSYKYSGGGGNGGDVTFHVGTPATVVVLLQSDPRYTIDNVTFRNDTNGQLSYPNPAPGTTATIQDKNTVAQTADYKVMIKDSAANATIPCDPRIINN